MTSATVRISRVNEDDDDDACQQHTAGHKRVCITTRERGLLIHATKLLATTGDVASQKPIIGAINPAYIWIISGGVSVTQPHLISTHGRKSTTVLMVAPSYPDREPTNPAGLQIFIRKKKRGEIRCTPPSRN